MLWFEGGPKKVAAAIPAVLTDAYHAGVPEQENWPQLVHRVFELAASFEGWSEPKLRGVEVPALVMVGDQDVVTVEHAIWLQNDSKTGSAARLATH
jgi:pimeloyl-ACP methyl ester carboxylesterase